MGYLLFAAVNLLLDFLLIPSLGLWGAVIGVGCAKILNVLIFVRIAWSEVPALRVPWMFLLRAFVASSPALLWLLAESRVHGWIPSIVGGLISLGLVVLGYRLLRVVGPYERDLLLNTKLPMRHLLLRLTGAPA